MLKYKLLKDNKQSNYIPIPYNGWNIVDKYMNFTCSTEHNIKDGSIGKIVGTHVLNNISNELTENYTFSEPIVFIVDNSTSFKIERFTEYPLYVKNVINSTNSKIIYFTNPHFFPSGSSVTIYMYYMATNLSIVKQSINVTYDTELSVKYNGLLPQQYEFYRDDFRFENAKELIVLSQNGRYDIEIPLFNEIATNGLQYDLIKENFIDTEIEKTIPPILNMEKHIYEPIIKSFEEPISEIVFNLHFREREGNDWLVKEGGFWNGYPEGVKNSTISTFKISEHQSDLLGFLGFSNGDIRYQKSNLKKSFMRLLFYDSNDQTNQKLLYYSTVFFDSGKQFGKMVKFNSGEYQYPIYDEDGNIIDEKIKIGIGVNGEPFKYTKTDGTIVTMSNETDEEKEKRRISSQINVKDRYNEEASSEGFYLYLFGDEDSNLRPKTIYLKVEFNHAMYGRTIPFMRPTSFDKSTLKNGNSLSMDAIINECKPKDGDTDGGYDLETFVIHSYIELRCEYNKKLKRHVYYLAVEDELSIDKINRKLILNLYEAKVK